MFCCGSRMPEESGEEPLTTEPEPAVELPNHKRNHSLELLWGVDDINDLIVQNFFIQLVKLQAVGKIKPGQIDKFMPARESIVAEDALTDQLTLLPGESFDAGVTAEMMDAPEMDDDFMTKLAAMEKAMLAGELPPSDSDASNSDSDASSGDSDDSDDDSGAVKLDDIPTAPAFPVARGQATTPKKRGQTTITKKGGTDRSTAAISMADSTDIASMDTEFELAAMAAEIPGPSPSVLDTGSRGGTQRTELLVSPTPGKRQDTMMTDMDTDEEIEALERKQNARATLKGESEHPLPPGNPSSGGGTRPGFGSRTSMEKPDKSTELTRSRKSKRSETKPEVEDPLPARSGLELQKTLSEVMMDSGNNTDDEINALVDIDVKIPLPTNKKKTQPAETPHNLGVLSKAASGPLRRKKKKKRRTRPVKNWSIGPTAPRPNGPTRPKAKSSASGGGSPVLSSSPGGVISRPILKSTQNSLMLPVGSPGRTNTIDGPEPEDSEEYPAELYRANETLNRVSHIFDVMTEHAQMFAGILQRKRGNSWNPPSHTAPNTPHPTPVFNGAVSLPTYASSPSVVGVWPNVEVEEKSRAPLSKDPTTPTSSLGVISESDAGVTPNTGVDIILAEAVDTDDEIERLAAGNDSFRIAAHTFREMFAPKPPKEPKKKKRKKKRKKKKRAGPTGPTAPPSKIGKNSSAESRGNALSLTANPSDVNLWGAQENFRAQAKATDL